MSGRRYDTMPTWENETKTIALEIPTYRADRGLARSWPDEYLLRILVENGVVTVEGNAAGLRGLAMQLLSLAESDVPPGYATTWTGTPCGA